MKQMKRSQLNPKPIKLTPIEACAFIGKAIKEYIENNSKRKQEKMDPAQRDVYQILLKEMESLSMKSV